MTLPILLVPHPVLKQRAAPVEAVDDSVRALLDEMLETMYAAPGVGLAAPQIGVSKRLLVIDVTGDDEPKKPYRMVNPEVVWQSEETNTYEEGCLSIPDLYADVTRPAEVKVRYLDETGATQEIHATGLLATCVQHEIDHLNGVLFIDHLSPVKRDMILRKLKKAHKLKQSA